jgi:putative ABC transport system ATP-binding protein
MLEHHQKMLRNQRPKPSKPGEYIIDLHGVNKTYQSAAGLFTALQGINLQVKPGEFVAVVGKSGSGKSTLLNIIDGIDSPGSGEVIIGGEPVHTMKQNQLALWRGRNVGVVFQFFQLLPTLTVLENVILPMDCCHTYSRRERTERALYLLEQLSVVEQAHKFPSELSGGEQQRVAIARAQANNPPIIVADEPTGNLDSHTADVILRQFLSLVSSGKTLVMVTHEREISQYTTRTVTLSDGRIISSD